MQKNDYFLKWKQWEIFCVACKPSLPGTFLPALPSPNVPFFFRFCSCLLPGSCPVIRQIWDNLSPRGCWFCCRYRDAAGLQGGAGWACGLGRREASRHQSKDIKQTLMQLGYMRFIKAAFGAPPPLCFFSFFFKLRLSNSPVRTGKQTR